MRLIRTIVVLSGLAAIIPSPPEEASLTADNAAGATASDNGYFEVATNTFSDLAAFCGRQPGVCETAGFVAHKLELKAKYGVRLIYEWANEANTVPSAALRPETAQSDDPIMTGSTNVAEAKPSSKPTQSTLRLEDMIPVWRGPVNAKTS
jgi:hypothetical protein